NASCPDIGTIPKLAEVLGVDVNELMGSTAPDKGRQEAFSDIVALVLKAVPLAMGVAVCVLSFLGQLEAKDGLGLLGIGLTCLAINNFRK
ncbi:MAG: XRE family transcriptional regulator, partial [Clostridia bacterium]|nr:XRE family transcriptional regulator [Clostridia bacterium]